uniref:Uncharacterized protein n=1 Tax=Anguilla anguilla TaxID=7936 RepID=A0A0E9XK66_ANGAN
MEFHRVRTLPAQEVKTKKRSKTAYAIINHLQKDHFNQDALIFQSLCKPRIAPITLS